MSKRQKKLKVLDFLDIAAVDSDGEDEQDLDDSFSRALYIDDEEDTSSIEVRPPRFVAADPYSIDPHEEAEKIKERYRTRRPETTPDEEQKNDQSIFQWAHTMENAAGESKVPIWMLRVTRGREFDVVGTILKMCATHTGENVLSATAPPCAAGMVYIECNHEAIVRNLQQKVAFIRRDIPPRQVASTDLRSALVLRPENTIQGSTWVRIRRKNGYYGDLGWVQVHLDDTPWYAVYVVPRMGVEETTDEEEVLERDTDSQDSFTSRTQLQNERLGRAILPFGKKRKHESPSHPAEWQPTFFKEHVSGKMDPSLVHEAPSGALFHYGFLILSLPQEDLTWHNVVPSPEEVQLWASSPFFLAADRTSGDFDNRDEPVVIQFAASLSKAIETAHSRGELQVGDHVRVVAKDELSSIGRVLEVGTNATVRVQLYDDGIPATEVELPATQLVLYHRVGDFVQVVIGRLTGMLGWITGLDWPQRQVDVVYEASITSGPVPFEDSTSQSLGGVGGDGDTVSGVEAQNASDEPNSPIPTPGNADLYDPNANETEQNESLPQASKVHPPVKRLPPLRGLKPPHMMTSYEPDDPSNPNPHYVLPWSYVRPRSDTSGHRAFGTVDAPVHKISVPRATQDPYKHIEVKAFDKNIGMFFGLVTATSADGQSVLVRSEGRAVNSTEKVHISRVSERHTGLTLEEYKAAPPDEIRALRLQQETARTAIASTSEFPLGALPLAQEAWPEVATGQNSSPASSMPSSTVSATVPLPSVIEPGRWLLHPKLRGKYLDVIIHGATGEQNSDCNDKIGVIKERPEKVNRGMKGSLKVRFGGMMATDRYIPIVNIFPLTTNEFEVIPREKARCILDLLNVYVIVIGPDATGDMSFIGEIGYTTRGGKIVVNSQLLDFPITSICRSDPLPRYS
ncbi:hypothetical protein R3P38DRAFT_3211777 [Favolaschia claudopus]|uniref:NGN domain-containing protein n=1 Tax=Favolaschia claudopus TaxID=2862362 RepID=A0AAW0AGZ8_9AGAR